MRSAPAPSPIHTAPGPPKRPHARRPVHRAAITRSVSRYLEPVDHGPSWDATSADRWPPRCGTSRASNSLSQLGAGTLRDRASAASRCRSRTTCASALLDVPAGTSCDGRCSPPSRRVHSVALHRSLEISPEPVARSRLCAQRDRARPESADHRPSETRSGRVPVPAWSVDPRGARRDGHYTRG